MDRKTQMNTNGVGDHPVREVARNAADLWHHVLTLSELQMRLLLVEIGQVIARLQTATLLVAAGCLLGFAALPIVLACVALVLAEQTQLTLASAFGLTSGVAVLISGILIGFGWRRLHQNASGIPRSRDEWKLNWSWLKETLRRERAETIDNQTAAKRRIY